LILGKKSSHVDTVVFEYSLVIGPRGQLGKSYCCSFGQYTPFTQQLLIVSLHLIVLLSHAGHSQGAFVNQIFEYIDILLKQLQFRVSFHLFQVGKLLDFKLI